MRAQGHRPSETGGIDPIPDEITSTRGKLVYCYLEATGGATVDDLERTLAMKKIGLFGVLRSLMEAGLVEKRDETYVVSKTG